ncbi:hypothetical protein V6Z11_A11G380200 [Gossypium hirsutum]
MEGTTPKWVFQLSNALKNTQRGESPEYMELIAVRIRKDYVK